MGHQNPAPICAVHGPRTMELEDSELRASGESAMAPLVTVTDLIGHPKLMGK